MCKIIYTGTKLDSKFDIKDEISKKQKYGLIYKTQCPALNCDETYIGELGKRFSECIIDDSGRDDKSHLYEHVEKARDENVNIDHFKILLNSYVKHEILTLNVQEQSVSLKLFN